MQTLIMVSNVIVNYVFEQHQNEEANDYIYYSTQKYFLTAVTIDLICNILGVFQLRNKFKEEQING